MDADITLYSLIFGESIFNDAIAIVMYNTVSDYKPGVDETYGFHQVAVSLGHFCLVFFGSILIGAFSALLIAFILKRQSSF
jgi:NhaP-type Na+/H+ or K+/H+ antiporter